MNIRNLHKVFSGWWMLAGCAAVMLGAVVLLANIEATGWGVLFILLCPLMHVFLHKQMHANTHGRHAPPAQRLITSDMKDDE